MLHRSTLEGEPVSIHQTISSRPMSPENAPAADRAASSLSQTLPQSNVRHTGPSIVENTSRHGATTPTMPGSVSGRVPESPPTSPSDNKIQEGLGSLNRWSQSTASSRNSPHKLGHDRGSHSRLLDNDNYESPIRYANPAMNTSISNISPRAVGVSMHKDDSSQRQTPNPTGLKADIPVLDLPDIGVSPTFSTGVMNVVPHQFAKVPPESTSMTTNLFQNPWSNRGIEMESVEPTNASDPFQHVHGDEFQTDEGSHSTSGRGSGYEKRRRGHSQKAMLSKALQKANTAVLLDNAANFEGAMDAYNDACQLLQLVMVRSSGGEEEKLKLQEIRDTYMIRVTELQRMDFSFREIDSKALPERPLSQESYGEMFQPIEDGENEVLHGENLHPSQNHSPPQVSKVLAPDQIPPRRQSLLPSALDDDLRYTAVLPAPDRQHHRSRSDSSRSISGNGNYGRAISPDAEPASEALASEDNSIHRPRYSELSLMSTHARDIYESTSWLDTIDESGASSPASMHSKASSVYLRHRRSRRFSCGTEAEFDAALDAAVEAAYDEGLEPAIDFADKYHGDDIVANARRNIELAKQKVREAEREAQVAMTRGQETRRNQQQATHDQSNGVDSDYLDEEAEEEERLLEEMTRGYVMDDFEFDLQSKSALPRQSDSSSFSGRTWESSTASNATMAGAALSPLAEDPILPTEDIRRQRSKSPSSNVTGVPTVLSQPALAPMPGPSVRARRMSGQNTTELKIETRFKTGSDVPGQKESSDPSTIQPPPPLPKDEPPTSFHTQTNKTLGTASALRSIVRPNKRNPSVGSFTEDTTTSSGLGRTQEDDNNLKVSRIPSPARPIGKVPSAPDNLGKPNSGLKSFRARNVSVPGTDITADSPETPSSSAFPPLDLQKGMGTAAVPILPTPTGTNFTPNGLPSGGLYLFDSHIHSPTSLGSPNLMAANAPMPLEPCPGSFLLRPFWLMRCIHQTITHPRGGYLTTKLFVPRDVWRVRNVKIKAVEEKVSNCDLLTAALLKLAKVDTYDADSVLEEMQSLESVLDQVQTSLSKKIGSEVGVQGAMPLFKTPQSTDDTANLEANLPPKASTGPGKSYLSSWRKLRSKNSGFGATASLSGSKEASKDNLTISSLPMTSIPSAQPAKPTTTQLQYNGPNANYMGALARLCDAAQVLDQIAQQVEDPGLKHSSPTLVGLELSTRHAAEFFGFYICRFALNDIGIMLDKFIKRGSEWVLI